MSKIKEINLEYGQPTVERAVQNMVNQLSTCKGQGCKAVILIHGYGSSGIGGSIKTAVLKKLQEPFLKGVVRDYCGGEHWQERKKAMLDIRPTLAQYSRRFDGNPGVTVVVLK